MSPLALTASITANLKAITGKARAILEVKWARCPVCGPVIVRNSNDMCSKCGGWRVTR